MNYITNKETNFINALKEDYKIRGKRSFIETIFLEGVFSDSPEFQEHLSHYVNLDYYKNNELYGYQVLSHTEWIMEVIESKFIGKYENHFIGIDTDAEYYSMGKDIQNLPFEIILNRVGNPEDPADLPHLIDYFKIKGVDYLDCVKEYKEFCSNMGLEYKESYQYMRNQVEEFETGIPD